MYKGGRVKMTSFSEFRRNAADFLDQVEKGEVVRIMRHGKPVADLTPVSGEAKPSWKNAPPQIPLKGVSLAKAILDDRRGLSVICLPEIVSALCRLRRERKLDGNGYASAKRAIALDLQDAYIGNISEPNVVRCVQILEENTLKAMGAFPIAAALEWETDVFASADVQQLKAARKSGLKVRAIP